MARRPGVTTLFVGPASPWENAFAESFNGKLRDELLDGEILCTLKEAQILIAGWRRLYNGLRPHSPLGQLPQAGGDSASNLRSGPTNGVWSGSARDLRLPDTRSRIWASH